MGKDRFTKSLVDNWTGQDPEGAWDWYSDNRNSLDDTLATRIFDNWARKQTDSLIQSLDTLTNEADRISAISAISAALAQRGTDQALDWVESLGNQTERDLAFQSVYNNTPKGIGAAIRTENGFHQIAEIIPGGALESTDLQPGDLIVSSSDSINGSRDHYGVDLRTTVDTLRGPPGTDIEIRVLRQNKETGALEEHSATVVRDLLILDSGGKG